jgi:hypothetical protein
MHTHTHTHKQAGQRTTTLPAAASPIEQTSSSTETTKQLSYSAALAASHAAMHALHTHTHKQAGQRTTALPTAATIAASPIEHTSSSTETTKQLSYSATQLVQLRLRPAMQRCTHTQARRAADDNAPSRRHDRRQPD